MYLFLICKIILFFFCHFVLCYEQSVESWWDIAACRAQIQYIGAFMRSDRKRKQSLVSKEKLLS